MNETLKNIRSRRSIRAFQPEQIKEIELQDILEAGIYAPTATNLQPWHFTVVQNKDLLDRLNEGFKKLARISDSEYLKKVGNKESFHVFYNAPTVIVLSADEKSRTASVDCAAAIENMLIAAESLNIGSCWIGFIAYLLNSNEGAEFLKEFGIPAGYKHMHAAAFGYKKENTAEAPARKENIVNYIK